MKKLAVILSLLVGVNASAGILLEPYVGYAIGGTEQATVSDNDITGVAYGGRIGWTLPLVFFAFDYSTGAFDLEQGSSKTDADYTAMGVVAGVSLPVLRIWAGYNFASELKIDSSVKYEGGGMKAGLGFKMPVLPISFNAEYIIDEYDEGNGLSLVNKMESKILLISVSAPFNL